MARRSDPELRRWWGNLIRSFDPDRWTVAEFCRRHDVSAASFYAWRRRLGAGGDADAGSPVSANASPPAVPAFLPIRITQDSSWADRSVQVHLPGGVRVEVPAGERELLLELIARVTEPAEEASS